MSRNTRQGGVPFDLTPVRISPQKWYEPEIKIQESLKNQGMIAGWRTLAPNFCSWDEQDSPHRYPGQSASGWLSSGI